MAFSPLPESTLGQWVSRLIKQGTYSLLTLLLTSKSFLGALGFDKGCSAEEGQADQEDYGRTLGILCMMYDLSRILRVTVNIFVSLTATSCRF